MSEERGSASNGVTLRGAAAREEEGGEKTNGVVGRSRVNSEWSDAGEQARYMSEDGVPVETSPALSPRTIEHQRMKQLVLQQQQQTPSTSSSTESTTSSNASLDASSFSLDPARQRFSAVPQDDYNELPTYPVRPSYKEFHANLRPCSRPVVFDGCPDDPHRPASVPIYQTATFEQPSSVEYGSYDYTRSGNPTRTALEKQVAMLENAHAAFCFGSGMSALAAVTRLLRSGDTLLVGSDIYGGMHRLTSRVTSQAGVKVRFVETWDLDKVRQALDADPNVKLLHMETPSNPLMRITDMRALAAVLHAKDIVLSVDSTMMTPHLQQPLLHGADIVVHSLTKFFGGHSDTSGGICCVRSEPLAKKIAFFQNAEGTGLSPFDCWLFLRGIKTLAIRVERAQENAMRIAAFLHRHPLVKEIFYAGLEPSRDDMLSGAQSALDYKIHMGQAKGGGCVMSFVTGDVQVSRRIIDSLRLFKLTVSFGSCNSLCEMPSTLSHASIPADQRTLPDDLIRLSVGIEDVNDLLEDLQQALGIAGTTLPLPGKERPAAMHEERVQPELHSPPKHPEEALSSSWTGSMVTPTLRKIRAYSSNFKVLQPRSASNTPKSSSSSSSDADPGSRSSSPSELLAHQPSKLASAIPLAVAFLGGVVAALLIQSQK